MKSEKTRSLTIQELKSLLLARIEVENSKNTKLVNCVKLAFDQKAATPTPDELAIESKVRDWVSGIIARRLLVQNRRCILISTRDLNKFIPEYIDFVERLNHEEFDIERRKIAEKVAKALFKNLLEMIYSVVPERRYLYDYCWRWITIVFDLATERQTSPIEILRSEGAYDEITRRMHTKEQYVALYRKTIDQFTDAQSLKRAIIDPIANAMIKAADLDDQESRELRQGIETEYMPAFRKKLSNLVQSLNAIYEEEVTRIYGAA